MTLTDEQKRAIDDLRVKGWGRRKIAGHLGVGDKPVRTYMERQGQQPTYRTPRFVVWDIETSDLNTSLGTLGVMAFLDMQTGHVEERTLHDFDGDIDERELALAQWGAEQYARADFLVGHNSQGFDKNHLGGVLLRHGQPELPIRYHFDTYLIARYGGKFRPLSYSMEHLADFFQLPMLKDKPSIHDWRRFIAGDKKATKRIRDRCISDVRVNALLLPKLLPGFMRWKGQK